MGHRDQKERQISKMLIAIAVLFLVTNFPFAAVVISENVVRWVGRSYLNFLYYNMLWEAGMILYMLNHSLNFYLYCMSAQFFRQAAVDLFASFIPCLKPRAQRQ